MPPRFGKSVSREGLSLRLCSCVCLGRVALDGTQFISSVRSQTRDTQRGAYLAYQSGPGRQAPAASLSPHLSQGPLGGHSLKWMPLS